MRRTAFALSVILLLLSLVPLAFAAEEGRHASHGSAESPGDIA